MKKKLLALIMCVVVIFGASVSVSAEPDLTIDFNKRYTDISEFEDVNDPYLDLDKNYEEKQQKRNIYAVVLGILLVVAVVIFVYTLRRVPDEATFEAKEKRKLKGGKSEDSSSSGSDTAKTLKDEEKPL